MTIVQRSPRDCKRTDQLCKLERDNLDVDGISILVQEKHVSIHYESGKWIEIPKRIFDPLVDFYNRPQPVTEKP